LDGRAGIRIRKVSDVDELAVIAQTAANDAVRALKEIAELRKLVVYLQGKIELPATLINSNNAWQERALGAEAEVARFQREMRIANALFAEVKAERDAARTEAERAHARIGKLTQEHDHGVRRDSARAISNMRAVVDAARRVNRAISRSQLTRHDGKRDVSLVDNGSSEKDAFELLQILNSTLARHDTPPGDEP
jgi:hypothetical protein